MAFDNIIGNENIKELLNKIVKSNNIIHSYIFTGEDGIGKKLLQKNSQKWFYVLKMEKSLVITVNHV